MSTLEELAAKAHAERWAPQMRRQNGLVLAQIVLRPDESIDIHYGPAVEDAPPRMRAGFLLALGAFMEMTSPKILAESDAIDEATS